MHQGNYYHSLSSLTRSQLHQSFQHILEWLIASLEPTDDQRLPPHLSTSTPFWRLLLSFESLLLYPPQPNEHHNINKAIDSRLKLLRSGHIRQLFHLMNSIPLKPPSDAPLHFASDSDPCPQAELLANKDNYRSAHQRIQSTLPVATMTDTNIAICEALYPPRIQRPTTQPLTHPATRHQHPRPHTTTVNFDISNDTLQQALQAMPTGKAYGPQNDYTDFLRNFALSQQAQSSTNPHRLTLIKNNLVPYFKRTSTRSYHTPTDRLPISCSTQRPHQSCQTPSHWYRHRVATPMQHNHHTSLPRSFREPTPPKWTIWHVRSGRSRLPLSYGSNPVR